jgi:hypothetical protein
MLVAWQPNSLASSLGARPARTSSIICSRNCAEYGGLGVCGLDTLDSFCKNNKVSVKWGQLQMSLLVQRKVTYMKRPSGESFLQLQRQELGSAICRVPLQPEVVLLRRA